MIFNWISVKDRMPIPFRVVLVSGGCAYWTGVTWRTCMECGEPEIQWEVKYWGVLPQVPRENNGVG